MKILLTSCLIVLLTVVSFGQGARTPARTLEGVVVDSTGGPQWIGIIVESNGKRYVVSINNSRYPDADPEVIGENVEKIGTRVKIKYTKAEPWLNDTVALTATQIVQLATVTTVQPSRSRSGRKSAVVTYVPGGPLGGSHMGTVRLKMNGRVIDFGYDPSTRFNNLSPNSRGYEAGAEWRIVYVEPSNVGNDTYPSLISATFTGRIVKPGNSNPQRDDWDSFWTSFRAAVRRRDRRTLKTMMIRNFEWSFGTYPPGDRRDTLFRNIYWTTLDRVLAQGVSTDFENGYELRIARLNASFGAPRAGFKRGPDGRWYWIFFVSGD